MALSDGSGADGFGGTGGYLLYSVPFTCDGVRWFKDIDGEYVGLGVN